MKILGWSYRLVYDNRNGSLDCSKIALFKFYEMSQTRPKDESKEMWQDNQMR